ncbi:MAG TPA: F0F1 ATP synthase subunit alpha [Candidatus Atribacteria bacterium]|nr:F0F1 ATP synthase subunit alpha [Candidatus Atribacteria bacterium]
MSVMSEAIKKAKEAIFSYELKPEIEEVGEIKEVQDGVATVQGLRNALMGEVLMFAGRIPGQAFNLEKEEIKCILLGDYASLRCGEPVFRTRETLEIPVGEELLGRVIDPLGNPQDGKDPCPQRVKRKIMYPAPQVIERRPVQRPLLTGIKIIDSMIPLGKGQRELIIGDRRTGKTTIALDTIINQKDKKVICIYVAIGQRLSAITEVVDVLQRHGALDYTIIVSTSAEDPPALVYLAPYSGIALAEYFMYQGEDALVVFDDLSKHAVAYRALSLLMRRPPGRESYPGDIFYIHSSLLERSAQLSENLGGGSITALPIVETQEGDIASYIPTNVISITDGQIYLESGLFARGFLPPINIGLSVSRVGGEAQTAIMKTAARRLRLDLAQYFELEDFARFSAELDEVTHRQLEHGKRVLELMTQPPLAPQDLSREILVVFAATQGLVDTIPLKRIKEWERALFSYAEEEHPNLLERLRKEAELSRDLEEDMKKLILDFNQKFLSGEEHG